MGQAWGRPAGMRPREVRAEPQGWKQPPCPQHSPQASFRFSGVLL